MKKSFVQLIVYMRSVVLCLYVSLQADLFTDAYGWPLIAGLSCALVLYACSSAAHLLQSRSELAHYVAFTFDYAGIGLYGLGSVVMHLHYCTEPAFYDTVHWFFIPTGCILAFLICVCCSVSKVRYQRPYPFIRKACCCCVFHLLSVACVCERERERERESRFKAVFSGKPRLASSPSFASSVPMLCILSRQPKVCMSFLIQSHQVVFPSPVYLVPSSVYVI